MLHPASASSVGLITIGTRRQMNMPFGSPDLATEMPSGKRSTNAVSVGSVFAELEPLESELFDWGNIAGVLVLESLEDLHVIVDIRLIE